MEKNGKKWKKYFGYIFSKLLSFDLCSPTTNSVNTS